MKNIRKGLDYKWVIVIICGLMVFTTLGFCSSAGSIYIKPITEALDISRTAYSVTKSVRFVTTAVVNLFFGALIYRFGAKKLIMAGFISLIASALINSFGNNVLAFCVGSFFLGVGLSFTTTTIVGSVVNRWCAKNKGTIMGFILATNGVGAALARNILTPIIYSEEQGFRASYRVVALILAGVGLLVLLLFRNDPKGEEKVRIKKTKAAATEQERTAFKKPYFYVSLVCIFLTGLVLQSVSGIVDPYLSDVGLDMEFITLVMSISSIVLSFTKFGIGFLYDKTGVKATSLICYISALLNFVAMLFITTTIFGQALSFASSILSPIALPLETIMLPIFAREIFGENGFNKALGIFVSVNTAGYAVGGPIADGVFDIAGSYKPWIIAASFLIIAIAVTMNVVITVAKRDRKRMELSEKEIAEV